MYLICNYIVYTDDVLTRPVFELEKIITFAGVSLPDRKKILKFGQQLRHKLTKNLTKRSDLMDSLKILSVGVDALEEEILGRVCCI